MEHFGNVNCLKSKVQIKPDIPYEEGFKKNRPFNLYTAPIAYPTEAQWENPYAFIQSLQEDGKKYGIVKIVPPASWNPKCKLDPARCYFKTRLQHLSKMGAVTRTTAAFVERLATFHKQEFNKQIDKQPLINGKKLNYYRLKSLVDSYGGYDSVTCQNIWNLVAEKLLGQPSSSTADIKTAMLLHGIYKSIIQPYEEYVQKVSKHGILNTLQQDDKEQKEIEKALHEKQEDKKKNKHGNKRRRTHRLATMRSTRQDDETITNNNDNDDDEEIKCTICKRIDQDMELRCSNDICYRDYHFNCIKDLISYTDSKKIPDNWWCPICIVGTGEFYFGEGDEFSLNEFKGYADEFYQDYLEEQNINNKELNRDELENTIESKFWNHVDDLDCDIEVEYGADLSCNDKSSGFSNSIYHPTDSYRKNVWNLNNFAQQPHSLLRDVKDISGVTSPWGYCGMMFSAFCWHSEDHYTYSINYQHLGATKTWYGIPGEFAEAFEKATRDEVPELFDKQPDILFQRATMISPEILTSKKIPVYAIDQHPGQFVMTFPKCYHAGFNHGFNYNEAVNYAPPDWVPFGEECMLSYKIQKRAPLFSHDRLLISIAKNNLDSETANWLLPHLKKLKNQESQDQERIKDLYPNLTIEKLKTDPQDYRVYQCCNCKTISYLSRVVVNGVKVYCPTCLPKPEKIDKDDDELVMEIRYDIDELKDLCHDVKMRRE